LAWVARVLDDAAVGCARNFPEWAALGSGRCQWRRRWPGR